MEKVIKNMNFKPLLDRAEFERLDPPKEGTMVNIRVGDEVEVKLLNDNVARVSVARSVVPEPECLFKIFVQMSADVAIDKKYYDELAKPEDYFKNTPICRALVLHISTLIANMTTNSAIGPMVTAPAVQA